MLSSRCDCWSWSFSFERSASARIALRLCWRVRQARKLARASSRPAPAAAPSHEPLAALRLQEGGTLLHAAAGEVRPAANQQRQRAVFVHVRDRRSAAGRQSAAGFERGPDPELAPGQRRVDRTQPDTSARGAVHQHVDDRELVHVRRLGLAAADLLDEPARVVLSVLSLRVRHARRSTSRGRDRKAAVPDGSSPSRSRGTPERPVGPHEQARLALTVRLGEVEVRLPIRADGHDRPQVDRAASQRLLGALAHGTTSSGGSPCAVRLRSGCRRPGRWVCPARRDSGTAVRSRNRSGRSRIVRNAAAHQCHAERHAQDGDYADDGPPHGVFTAC